MKKIFASIITAFSLYSRIPSYKYADFSDEIIVKTAKYLPLVGIMLGIICAGIFLLASCFFSKSISILLTIVTGLLLTGALHEDGFIDTLDAFGGGSTKDKILKIMKDPTVGSFGLVGFIVLTLIKFQSLVEIQAFLIPIVLVAGFSLSRATAISLMVNMDYVRSDESSKFKSALKTLSGVDFIIVILIGLLPLVFMDIIYLTSLIPLIMTRLLFSLYYRNKINGYTGDCLGAVQQTSEVVFYLFVLLEPWKFL